jgi:hypothetical protein
MVTLTIGTFTFADPIFCYDWSDLLKGGAKRGGNRPVPGVAGRAVRPRVADEVRAGLAVRIIADTHQDVYGHLATLRAVCDVNVPQTLTLNWGTGSASADCIVEEMGPPSFQTPTICTLVVDVTLPDGPLNLASP